LWLFAAILLVAFVALLVWLKQAVPPPEPVVVQPVPTPEPPPVPPHKPRFEFYNTLPKQQMPVAPEVAAPATPSEPVPVAPPRVRADGRYRVQIGSYVREADAERLRAELAFSGLETHIQSVTLADGKTYHRVMAGPYAGQAAAVAVRRQLQAQGYPKPLVIRQP